MATLLVVEDNLAHQCIMSHFCELYGYTAQFVLSGEEAVATLKEGAAFTAILIDLSLPGINGIETARRIRELEKQEGRERTPLIALTADPDRETQCREADMDAFFSKPFAAEELGKTLSQWKPHDVRPSLRLLPNEAQRYFDKNGKSAGIA